MGRAGSMWRMPRWRGGGRRGGRRSARPILESLEDRQLLSTYMVENTCDSGPGSLRYEITLAFSTTGTNTVEFDPTVFSAPQTITLSSGPLVLTNTGGNDTITGPAAGVTINGGGTSSVFQVNSGVVATISGLNIGNGATSGDGGGVSNAGYLSLIGCTVSDNTAAVAGGGLANYGTAVVTDCTFSNNVAKVRGGGLYNSGTATLTGCTFDGGEGGILKDGGFGGGGLSNVGTVTLTGCTISNNAAGLSGITPPPRYGGGLLNSGTATLTACTISGNSAIGSGGGIYNYGSGCAALIDTIVAGNVGPDGADDINGDEGTEVTGSYNLIGTGGSGGITGGTEDNIVLTSLADLDLAPPANNGGPTQTMALLPGSAAIGMGTTADDPVTTAPITTDQRGQPLDSPPDIGAYQLNGTLVLASATFVPDGGGTLPAGSFSEIVAFGDSGSDAGNSGAAYHDGRFTDGPNWVDQLAAKLGVADPGPSLDLGPGCPNCTNYAYGGAKSTPRTQMFLTSANRSRSTWMTMGMRLIPTPCIRLSAGPPTSF